MAAIDAKNGSQQNLKLVALTHAALQEVTSKLSEELHA